MRAAAPPRLGVDAQQLALVVEHLLEVGDAPVAVDAVAVEAAAELVVEPAPRHLAAAEREERRASAAPRRPAARRSAASSSSRFVGVGNFGAPPKPPCSRSARSRSSRAARGEAARRRGAPAPRRRAARGAPPGSGREVSSTSRALLAVGARDRAQHVAEGRQPVARLGREVGAAVERPAVGRAEHGERPAAVAVETHDGVHVDLVDVGPLLAVDLHGTKSSFISAAVSSSSKDSRSITWHQWQAL